ncbi:MAG TPA: MBL fold metallo-hydrolase [Acidimicrobiia bacterium]|nr:MBL fold metallo-hydrolase [Acidimicrobiia bacterium]
MLIVRVPAWLAETNAYIVANEPGGLAVVVDAPPDPERVGAVVAEHGLAVAGILLTHGHIDHSGGSGALSASTRAAVHVHPDDDFLTLHPAEQLAAMFGMTPPGSYDLPQRFESLAHGQILDLAGFTFEVRHTPGHTPGHCCFLLADQETLFSGDQLFAGSIGRFDFPYGDGDALFRSMRNQVMTLDDEVRVLPGHGPETTIGRERRTNPFRGEWS